MTEYAIRPFQPDDARYFPEFADLGIRPEHVPNPAFTGMADGQVVICAGVVPGMVLKAASRLLPPRPASEPYRRGMGEAWACLVRPCQHGRWVLKTVRGFVGALLEGDFDRLEAMIRVDRVDWQKWIRFHGFEIDYRFGRNGYIQCPDGVERLMFARIAGGGR